MLDWYPKSDEPAYTGRGASVFGSVAWSLVCAALAAALVLSAVESSRQARDLDEQMERLEQQILQVEERNAQVRDGRQ